MAMELSMLLSWISLGIVCVFVFLLKWNEIRCRRRTGLPPGTMGWPILGETLQLIHGEGPDFLKKQKGRYGNVFKTHMLGSPTIVSMDPELNRYILLNEAKGLIPSYPKAMVEGLGKYNIGAVYGATHKLIRGSAMSLIGPSSLREKLLPKIDRDVRLFLKNWEDKVIDIQENALNMAFFISFRQIVEGESSSIFEAIKEEFDKVEQGTCSLPIYLPGTNYYKALQARKNVIKLLRQIIEKRRASPRIVHNDMLQWMLANAEDSSNNYKLNDEEIYDHIFMLLNSGYETESAMAMMSLKYLHDHPMALQELRDEHSMIRQEKSNDEESIDWLEYKKMRFTRAVILETLRLATIVNGVLRRPTQDVELNGFHIPKGWKIYLYMREINYDPYLYPEPFKFNPWRWMKDENLESHHYLLFFGGGARLCPGKELGLCTIAMFLHYFVTWYRWEEIGEPKIIKFPRVRAPKGFFIRVMKNNE